MVPALPSLLRSQPISGWSPTAPHELDKTMLKRPANYESLTTNFIWTVPDRFNIGVDVIDRHADGTGRLALTMVEADGTVRQSSFDDLKRLTNQLANALTGLGTADGDRVAILLSQSLEAGVAHGAVYKAGLVALPLFILFGEEALAFRLTDSAASVLITDQANWAKVAPIRDQLPSLHTVLIVDGAPDGTHDFWQMIDKAKDHFVPVDTAADDPALIIYTSGTTGQPKGALHGHRVLLGHLPGVELPQNFFHIDPSRAPDDHFWTPADWAWIGGLLDVLLPAWHHGYPVMAHRMAKFDPDHAFDLMARHKVRHSFLPPTALKLMRLADPAPFDGLRSIGSGGENLGSELLAWGQRTFGLTINEFYGQTECNLVVGNCADLFDARPGSMGRPIPGHTVAIIDGDGMTLGAGEVGQIAVRRPDPVMFLRYWNNQPASEAKFIGDWLLTGDTGWADEDGYLWYVGRDDDVITTAGYRVGPSEIEDCLAGHPDVALSAVVGAPDPVRTEVVKAVIVLKDGVVGDDAVKKNIQDFVKHRLAAHEYPRIVEFADSLPMTATGKIIRRALR